MVLSGVGEPSKHFFVGDGFCRFCKGVLGKMGVWVWFFDGEFVVDRGGFVVN
jgi:hypothetical protein